MRPRRKDKFQSIQTKFFKVIILRVFLPTFVFLIISMAIIVNQTIKSAADSLDYQNKILLTSIDSFLASMKDLTNYVVLDPEIQNVLSLDYSEYPGKEVLMKYQSNKKVEDRLITFLHLNSNISSVFLFPENYDHYYRADATIVPFADVTEYDFYKNIVDNNGRITTQIVLENPLLLSHPDTIIVGRSIINPLQNNRLMGVFLLNVSVDQLRQFCDIAGQTKQSRNYIYWQDTIIGSEKLSKQETAALRKIYSDQNGDTEDRPRRGIHKYNGVLCFSSISAPDANGIRIINITPLSAVIQMNKFYLLGITSVTLIMVLLLLTTIRVSVRKITIPVVSLQNAMVQTQDSDNYNAIDFKMSNDEIGKLAETYNHLIEHIRNLIIRIKAEENEKMKIELLVLQSQISPHFIYNTLESIKVMAKLQGAVPVADMIDKFTSFLRYCARNDQNIVTLREEREIAENYMTIMNFRYMGSFQHTCTIPEDLLQCIVPKFILQPILENAIKHGFAQDTRPDKRVAITAVRERSVLSICITDNGIGITDEELERIASNRGSENLSDQIGLYNINQRIRLLYGKEFGLLIESIPGEYTSVSYKLPYIEPKEE